MLGDEGYGVYASVFIIVDTVALLGSFCFEYKLIPLLQSLYGDQREARAVALVRWSMLANVVLVAGLSTVLLLAGETIAGLLGAGDVFLLTLVVFVPYAAVFAVRSTFFGALTARGRMKTVFWVSMVVSRTGTLLVASGLWLVAKGFGVEVGPASVAGGFVVAETLVLSWLLATNRFLWAAGGEGGREWRVPFKELFRGSASVLFHNVGGVGKTHGSKLLVGMLGQGVGAVGVFHFASLLSSMIQLPFQMFTKSYGPLASELLMAGRHDELRELYRESSLLSSVCGLGGAVMLVLWGESFLALYGDAFLQAYWPAVMLVFSAVLLVVVGPGATRSSWRTSPGCCGSRPLYLSWSLWGCVSLGYPPWAWWGPPWPWRQGIYAFQLLLRR